MQKITIRQATKNDINDLYRMQLKYIGHPYTKSQMASYFDNNYVDIIVADLEHEIVGYVMVISNIDALDIMQIVVETDYRRQHIASNLMKQVINLSSAYSIPKILLEVRVDNPANEFYKNFGFNFVYVRKNYYGDCDANIYEYNVEL